MNRFAILDTPIPGLWLVERQQFADERGFLTRLFCAEELASIGWCKPVAQINHTLTRNRGTVRGLHYQQPPHAEMKLVTCLRGAIWDVAVDLRSGSPTFMQWYAQELSASNRRALLIPEGFAHGFQTLTDDGELLYLHSAAYEPSAEAAANPMDPRLAIEWPLRVTAISERDAGLPCLADDFGGVII